MSSLERKEGSRVKNKNVIQYASDQINELDSKNTMEGIKRIVSVDRITREAIITHIAEKDQIVDTNTDRTPTVTGTEIEQEFQKGSYREMIDR